MTTRGAVLTNIEMHDGRYDLSIKGSNTMENWLLVIWNQKVHSSQWEIGRAHV